MSDEIKESFEMAQMMVKEKTNVSNDQLLTLYKFYKQATCGNCNIICPGIFDRKGVAKWTAWNSVKGMKKEDAMFKYCEFVMNL